MFTPDICYVHFQNETAGLDRWYLRCGECGHVFREPKDLRKAARHTIWSTCSTDPRRPWFKSSPFAVSWCRAWWECVKVRSSKVFFCPECSHDF
jgi:hypothetical protein